MVAEHDVVIIGAGITGAGIFSRLAGLGLKVLLLDKNKPGAATTGASSALIHGGLRYLPYDVGTAALSSLEGGVLQGLFPDLLSRRRFLWPVFRGDLFGLEMV